MSRAPTRSINPEGKDLRIFNQMGSYFLNFQMNQETIRAKLQAEIPDFPEKFQLPRFDFNYSGNFTYKFDKKTQQVLEHDIFKPLFLTQTSTDGTEITLTPTPLLEEINNAIYGVERASNEYVQVAVDTTETQVNIIKQKDNTYQAVLSLTMKSTRYTYADPNFDPNNPVEITLARQTFSLPNTTNPSTDNTQTEERSEQKSVVEQICELRDSLFSTTNKKQNSIMDQSTPAVKSVTSVSEDQKSHEEDRGSSHPEPSFHGVDERKKADPNTPVLLGNFVGSTARVTYRNTRKPVRQIETSCSGGGCTIS